ncbi:hypothetical protein JTB14_036700 [Gonioctena quinquepunctata]|nr:hypothetical protein JTB14_036700 [Gonioctena quinquepunctata]
MHQNTNKTQDHGQTMDLTEASSPKPTGSSLRVPTEVHRSLSALNEKKKKVFETSLDMGDPESPYRRIEIPEAFALIEALDTNKTVMAAQKK